MKAGQGSRVMLFFDILDFRTRLKEAYPNRYVSFQAVFAQVAAGRAVAAIHFFTREPDPSLRPDLHAKQGAFLQALAESVPDLCVHRLRLSPSADGGWDADPLIAALRHELEQQAARGAFDVAVLVAGRAEYAPVLQTLRAERGLATEVAFFPGAVDGVLAAAAGRLVPLTPEWLACVWERPGQAASGQPG